MPLSVIIARMRRRHSASPQWPTTGRRQQLAVTARCQVRKEEATKHGQELSVSNSSEQPLLFEKRWRPHENLYTFKSSKLVSQYKGLISIKVYYLTRLPKCYLNHYLHVSWFLLRISCLIRHRATFSWIVMFPSLSKMATQSNSSFLLKGVMANLHGFLQLIILYSYSIYHTWRYATGLFSTIWKWSVLQQRRHFIQSLLGSWWGTSVVLQHTLQMCT